MDRHLHTRQLDQESQQQHEMIPSGNSYFSGTSQPIRSTYSGTGQHPHPAYSCATRLTNDHDQDQDHNHNQNQNQNQNQNHNRDETIGETIDDTIDHTIGDTYDDRGHGPRRDYNGQTNEVTTLQEEETVTSRSYSGEENEATSKRYDDEKYNHERSAIKDAQSVAYTAFTMNFDTGQTIVDDLRNVGVTVLSLESLSTAAMIHYMDAVTTMRLGDENDEKCMLYTDRMGRVFNVVISGGAEGLSHTWANIEASFSAWLAIVIIPHTIREIISYSFGSYATNTLAFPPIVFLFYFGLVLPNETSHAWLAMSVMVRGTNSVGSHVWRTPSLVDYPRVILLIVLSLASTAPENSSVVGDTLTVAGALLGGLIILCNLGSRAWKKLEIGYVDSNNTLSPFVVVLASLLSGITFPYIALRNVHGGTDDNDGEAAIEKVIFNPNGKRARQNVTFTSCTVAFVFILSNVELVQEALGFEFNRHGGIVNLMVSIWWFLSTIASLGMCHRLDASKSKKIQPFLKKDETSPVGYIVPSIPNIVIHPSLSTGKMILPVLAYGSDVICVTVVMLLAALIIWMGMRQIQSGDGSSSWISMRVV